MAWIKEKPKEAPQADGSVDISEPLYEEPFIDDVQQLASQDPIVLEAEKMFGKDFVDVVED